MIEPAGRRSRRAVAVSAALIGVVLGFAGGAIAGDLAGVFDLAPWFVDPATDNDGAGVEPVATSASYVVSSDATYTLRAHQSDHGLCLDLHAAGVPGSGGGCGFDLGEPVGHVVEALHALGATFVHGPVSSSVSSVSVSMGTGKPVSVQTVASPAGLGFSGRFYAVRLLGVPADGIQITGFDSAGAIVAHVVVPPPTGFPPELG